MDITVEDVDGLPANTYISVRCGEARRQALFRSGEVLSFPLSATTEKVPKAYTVDVFRKVGSKQVSLAGIGALGGKLRHEELVIPSLELHGSPITASLSAALSGNQPSTPGSRKQEVAAKARQYLEKYDVQPVLHEMFAQMLERLPGDPLAFMADFLEQRREAAEERSAPPRDFAHEAGLGDDPLPGFAEGQGPEALPDLGQHHSIASDVLRKYPDLYGSLRSERTALGVTFAQCVKPGIDCPGHELMKVAGAFAGDEESYELFQRLFDPVVAALHTGWTPDSAHPSDDNPAKLSNTRIDPTGRYAVFASMDVRRNLKGIRLLTCCSREERRQVERVLSAALAPKGRLRGSYLPLRSSQSYPDTAGGMSLHQEERLRGLGMLFSEPDSRMRLSAGLGRHWPDARGVFVGEAQGLCLWCNEEDHLRFFAKQDSVDLKKLWTRLDEAMLAVEEAAKGAGSGFSRTERLGYTTACPSRLGSALRVSVSMKLPLLAAAVDLQALCRSLDMQSSQIEGASAHGGGGVWNVSSGDCLGISEVDLINGMIEGCRTLVGLEQRLDRGEAIYDAMPGLGSEALPGFPAGHCPGRLPDLAGNRSLVAAVLREDPGLYARLRGRRTGLGVGLAACIKPGVDDAGPQAACGLVAGDGGCYATFHELFDPVISRLHGGAPPEAARRADAGLAASGDIEVGADASRVVAVRVDLRRNLRELRFAPCCSRNERTEVERLVVKAMLALQGAYSGDYLPLAASTSYAPKPTGLSRAEQAQLCERGLLFSEPTSPSRLSAGLGRDWPEARGAVLAGAEDLWVWVNEEDHVRVTARQEGRNLRAVLARALDCAQRLEAGLQSEGHSYFHDGRLGYLTVDPLHLGSGLRCAATLRLPRLSLRPEFLGLCAALRLQAAWREGAWDVANGASLGMSEMEIVSSLEAGCSQLLRLEQELEGGRAIDEDLRALGAA